MRLGHPRAKHCHTHGGRPIGPCAGVHRSRIAGRRKSTPRRTRPNRADRLPSAVDVFRTPDERFEDLPGFGFQPHYAEVDGLRLHYVDEGAGDPVICFHGEPTWSYLYRKMVDPLVQGGSRVICPDYPGFGRSDKPTEREWYTYDRHVEHMTALLDQVDVTDATVVVQDWG